MATLRGVEILVHIAAPSKASDDTRYRSLATAYIDFQPQKHLKLSEPAPSEGAVLSTPTPVELRSSQSLYSSQQSSSDGCFPSLRSPQASFGSVLDNANSPSHVVRARLRTPRAQRLLSQNIAPQSSWKTPPSLVQDSIPENDATTALLTTPTRVLEHYLQNFHSPSQASQANIQESQRLQHKRVEVLTLTPAQRSLDQDGKSRNPSTIPCTPENRPPPVSSSAKLGKVFLEAQSIQARQDGPDSAQTTEIEDEIIEDTVMIHEPETPATARADSEPPPSKRPRQNKSYISAGALLRTSSDIGPHTTPDGSTRSITFLPVHGFKYNSTELHPPEPSVSCSSIDAEDLITPGLKKLAVDLKIPKRYIPESTSRDLRPFERGYWLIDCTDWPQDLKTETWVFLANYIGTGVAGWGVSCRRDEQFTWLRLYCWGCLVAHIYLLGYLASRRKICYSDATWIDCEEKGVVIMRKKEGVWVRM